MIKNNDLVIADALFNMTPDIKKFISLNNNLMMRTWLLCLVLLGILSSCSTEALYEKNNAVACDNWQYSDTVAFNFKITDSAMRYNLLLNVRHRDVYEWQNLFVKMVVINPKNEIQTKEINIPLCTEDGAWIGNCTGDLCFLRVYLAEHKKLFPINGNYKVLIMQDMRVSALKNILAIGLRVEPSPSKKKPVNPN